MERGVRSGVRGRSMSPREGLLGDLFADLCLFDAGETNHADQPRHPQRVEALNEHDWMKAEGGAQAGVVREGQAAHEDRHRPGRPIAVGPTAGAGHGEVTFVLGERAIELLRERGALVDRQAGLGGDDHGHAGARRRQEALGGAGEAEQALSDNAPWQEHKNTRPRPGQRTSAARRAPRTFSLPIGPAKITPRSKWLVHSPSELVGGPSRDTQPKTRRRSQREALTP